MVIDCNRVDSARASQYWQRLLGWLEEVEIRPKKQNITTRSHGLKKDRREGEGLKQKKAVPRRVIRKHMIFMETRKRVCRNEQLKKEGTETCHVQEQRRSAH